ncbi:MAG: protein-L-isoaspartate O-methyltransferase [Altererythrobacter sp.]|nr:protein-L-isoaspartate O-methyltransferase [Altererythrobacter sp.]MBT8432388.1 protein-L-isoaspartate O-methyltransferase [Altererythrobacter sp.]NNE50739.1 protein-L-isoaspartate O-methyltransferase [Altererythrobacter sp.]NNF93720.1 protein-L-isoaspartate O-methyltransferase [Altererythrobacter sp.]NNK46619.1 protein-L-isoaspartate O-methyltransferase [Altererythrobacter sp.]
MIDSQLRTSGVNEPFVIARMGSVAREDFVPSSAKAIAYMDRAIPLGDGAFLAAPIVHGKMLAEARPGLDDNVLLVENGSAYLAELVKPLVGKLDTKSVEDIASGKKGRKTYSLILIDGAIEELPETLVKRLEDNGRIVTGVVERGVTRLATGRKVAGNVVLQPLADIGIPVLHAFDKPKEWSF